MTINRPIMTSKAELLRHTRKDWEAFVAYVDALTPEQWTGPTDDAGWTVKDHVAHVSAWDRADLESIEQGVTKQQALHIPDELWQADGSWTLEHFVPINEIIRQRHLDDSIEEIKAYRGPIQERIIALLDGFSEEELAATRKVPGLSGGRNPLRDDLYANFPSHYLEHLDYIKAIVEPA